MKANVETAGAYPYQPCSDLYLKWARWGLEASWQGTGLLDCHVGTYQVLWCNWIVTRGVALIKDLSPFVRVLVLAEIQNYKGQDVKVKLRFVQKSKLILGGGTGGGRGGGNNLFWNIWSYSAKMPEYENYEQVEGKNKLSPPPSYKAVISSTSRGNFENFFSFFFTFYFCE